MTALDTPHRPGVLANARDTGGLSVDGGRTTIRPGVLYRSALPKAGDGVPAGLPVWPCAAVVDLRSDIECGEDEHPLAALGAQVHRIPLMADEDVLAPADTSWLAGGLGGLYREMVTRSGTRFATILRVAADADGPVLVHCAAGKDRTGVSVAMLLTLAGADRAAVVADYERTAEHLPAIMARLADQGPVYTPVEGTECLMGAPAEAIEAVLDLWESHPGGVRGWVEAQGAEPDLVDRWIARVHAG